MTDSRKPAPLSFGRPNPILRVRDVGASRDYYVKMLGFRVHFETEDFISVSRGECGLFLCRRDQGAGWGVA